MQENKLLIVKSQPKSILFSTYPKIHGHFHKIQIVFLSASRDYVLEPVPNFSSVFAVVFDISSPGL
jgi:hypothetical protein